VLVIDHARKDGSASDEYSTAGSGGKDAAADAVYFVTKVEPYSEDTEGAVSITVTSDRQGRLPVDAQFYRCGGQGRGNAFTFRACRKTDVGASRRVRTDVEAYLQRNSGQEFAKADLTDAVEARATRSRRPPRSSRPTMARTCTA